MLAGHYAPSFALRHAANVPLWVLFLAAQFVDILWAGLIIVGVEKVRIVPDFNPSNPLDLYYMPFSHSLAATLAWALLVGWLGSFVWQRRGGIVIGICVLSHWVLDLAVHLPDLPLYGDQHKVGLGLWNEPVIAFALEALILLLAVAIYSRKARVTLPFWIFAFAMLGLQAASFVIPIPETPQAFGAMQLFNYFALAAVAGLLERRWG